jgi:hypothetical protein
VLDPVTTPVRVKYLGAFLYLGGYLILVKVGKGKAYRVKHWFSLAQFEMVDIPPDIGTHPLAFPANILVLIALCSPGAVLLQIVVYGPSL